LEYALYPAEFIQSRFETFAANTNERAASLALARDYANQVNRHGGGFLVFVGMPGTGKTRLSANIVGQLCHVTGLYVRQGELINALRATYGRDKYEYDSDGRRREMQTPLHITQSASLLILDEIGCTTPANDERMLLDELLKYRFEQHKPTILISNLPLKVLNEFFGDAVSDRIHQATGGGKYIFTFKGESYRRGAGDKYLRGPD
jgi:DNA replication protein DnaC